MIPRGIGSIEAFHQTAASTCRRCLRHASDDVRPMRQEADMARVLDGLESSSRDGLRQRGAAVRRER